MASEAVNFDTDAVVEAIPANAEKDVHFLNETQSSGLNTDTNINSLHEKHELEDDGEEEEKTDAGARKDKKKKKKKEKRQPTLEDLMMEQCNDIEELAEDEWLMSEQSGSSDQIVYTRSGAPRTKMIGSSFFDKMRDMPSISDISLSDVEEDEDRIKSKLSDFDETLDIGHFVHPLSGEILESTSSTSEASSEVVVEESSEIDDFELEPIKDDDFLISPVDLDGNDVFFQFEELPMEPLELAATEPVVPEILYKKIAADFLNKLLDDIVEKVERENEIERIKKSLDKKKMFEDINKLIIEYGIESSKNKILTKKIADNFKRTKLMEMITPLEGKQYIYEKNRYNELMRHIDKTLLAEQEFDTLKAELLPRFLGDLEKAEAEVNEATESFENTLRSTLVKPKFTEMNKYIDSELRKMKIKNDEVNLARYELINRQHTFATLEEQLLDLEYITDELTVSTFEKLEQDCISLEKKIEEKEGEANRLKTLCFSNMHAFAHMKEKYQSLARNELVEKQEIAYKSKMSIDTRQKTQKIKLERNRIRREMQAVSFAGGLLDKPALMYEYDKSVRDVKRWQDYVNKLKRTYNNCRKKALQLNPYDSIARSIQVPNKIPE